MKKEIKFNHDAQTITEALGVTQNVNQKTKGVIVDFMTDPRRNNSVLAEYIHKDMDYETILLLATHQVHKKIEDAFGDDKLAEAIKSLVNLLGKSELNSEDEKAKMN